MENGWICLEQYLDTKITTIEHTKRVLEPVKVLQMLIFASSLMSEKQSSIIREAIKNWEDMKNTLGAL